MIPRFPGDPPRDLSQPLQEVKIRIDKPLDGARLDVALVHFLTRSVSREQLNCYVADVLAGSPKDIAFEKLMGKSVEQVQPDWIEYIKTLQGP